MLKKTDFYYGAFLSFLFNEFDDSTNFVIVEPMQSRDIYSIETNYGKHKVYIKYVTSPTENKNKKTTLWNFTFSNLEIELIRKNNITHLALICAREGLNNCEIAILTYDQAIDCLDIDYLRNNYRISIKYQKDIEGLKAYGTGRSDIKDGKDNTLRITRDIHLIFRNSICSSTSAASEVAC